MTTTHPLIGKPFTFYKDGKRRVIGKVIDVDIVGDGIQITAKITDSPIAEMLGVDTSSELKGILSDVNIQAT